MAKNRSMCIFFNSQIAEIRKRTLWMKIREWSRSVWNKLDIVAMILFFVGFGWSFYDRRVERVVLAVDLVIWVIKFAQFYRMFSTLGPYLIMIYRMVSTVKTHIRGR